MLASSRAQLPLVVQRPLRGPCGEAIVTLLTPAAALFDRDAVQLEVHCASGTDVTLTTPAATRLNRCDVDQITFNLDVVVEDGACFRYLPHETLPFRGTRYTQRLDIEMAPMASAALLDIVAPGPTHSRFAYDALTFHTTIRRHGQTVVRERFTMRATDRRALSPYTHYGSALLLQLGLDVAAATTLNDALACVPENVLAGASWLPNAQGLGIRILGTDSQTLRSHLLSVLALPPRLWDGLPG
ncbi:MAG: hypothetical protein NVSMB2_21330 [Chloroflexota bacterium]